MSAGSLFSSSSSSNAFWKSARAAAEKKTLVLEEMMSTSVSGPMKTRGLFSTVLEHVDKTFIVLDARVSFLLKRLPSAAAIVPQKILGYRVDFSFGKVEARLSDSQWMSIEACRLYTSAVMIFIVLSLLCSTAHATNFATLESSLGRVRKSAFITRRLQQVRKQFPGIEPLH